MSKLPPMTSVSSSAMTGFHYDPASRALTVQFRGGGAYSYAGVSAARVQAMQDAPSLGGYFAAHIKPKHPATPRG